MYSQKYTSDAFDRETGLPAVKGALRMFADINGRVLVNRSFLESSWYDFDHVMRDEKGTFMAIREEKSENLRKYMNLEKFGRVFPLLDVVERSYVILTSKFKAQGLTFDAISEILLQNRIAIIGGGPLQEKIKGKKGSRDRWSLERKRDFLLSLPTAVVDELLSASEEYKNERIARLVRESKSGRRK